MKFRTPHDKQRMNKPAVDFSGAWSRRLLQFAQLYVMPRPEALRTRAVDFIGV
jgi:hypothetical protein